MTKMKFKFTAFILGSLALAACSNNDNPDDELNYYMDFVTLEANNSDGSVMTFRKEGDSPLVTLTSTTTFPSGYYDGERVIIQYQPLSNTRYESGPVSLIAAVPAIGEGKAPVASTAEEQSNWASGPIAISSLWRAGEYINMVFQATTNGDPKQVSMFVDEKTIGTSNPTLYFVYEAGEGSNARNYTFYGSWSIQELWENPATTSLTIFFADPSSTVNTVVLKK